MRERHETATVETAKQLVPQATQPVSPEQKQSKETTIVTAPATDVSDWKKRAKTYYKRSIKTSSEPATRQRNRDTYEEYRTLLETVGVGIEETGNNITFKNLRHDTCDNNKNST